MINRLYKRTLWARLPRQWQLTLPAFLLLIAGICYAIYHPEYASAIGSAILLGTAFLLGLVLFLRPIRLAESSFQELPHGSRVGAQTIEHLETGAHVILWEFSMRDIRHTYISSLAREIFGYSIELLQQPEFWNSIVHKDDLELAKSIIRKRIAQNEDYRMDYRIMRPDGEIIWIRDFGHVAKRDAADTIISGYYLDVTAEVRSKLEIERQSRLLNTLYQLSQDISEVIDAESLCRIVGQYLREEFGYYHVAVMEADCVAGILHAIHISGAYENDVDPIHHTAPFNRGVMGKTARTRQEVIVNDVANSDLFFAVSETKFSSEACFPLLVGGELLGLLNIDSLELGRFDDNEVDLLKAIARQLAGGLKRVQLFKGLADELTERIRAEQALEASEDRLEMAMHGGQTVIWDWNIPENRLHISSNWSAVTGLPDLSPLSSGGWLEEHIAKEDRRNLREEITRHLKSNSEFLEARFRVVREGAEPVWLQAKGRVFSRDEAGRALRALGTYHNISLQIAREDQRRQLEQQMHKTQKLESLGVLAGGLAHDFNNLLTGILGNASLAIEEVPHGNHVSQMLDEIIKGGVQAAELTRQMLAYSGQGSFVVEPIDINETVNSVVKLLSSVISKKAELQFSLQPDLPAVMADGAQIVQVIMNLVSNASDALEDHSGMISLSTHLISASALGPSHELTSQPSIESYIRLVVTDTGCGMDQSTLQHLFDPFYTTKERGHGLGLSAVQGIVRSHHGHIEVASSPGQGSCFTLLLPACQEFVRTAKPGGSDECDIAGRTVLFVDDEEGVRMVAARILSRCGCTVLQAADGRQGLDCFAERRADIDFVILDLTMPVMSGTELLREIRRLDEVIPVIVTSGYAEDEVTNSLGSLKHTSFVQKPFTRKDLLQAVHQTMSVSMS